MKRTVVALLCAVFMTGSVISCGEAKKQVSSEVKTQETGQGEEIQESSEDEQTESDEEKTENEKTEEEVPSPSEGQSENMTEDLTMTALRENGD